MNTITEIPEIRTEIPEIKTRFQRLDQGLRRLDKIAVIVLLLFLQLFNYSTIKLSNCYAAIPQLINYQGKLTDSGGNPITGTRSVTVRLYSAETGGNLLWEETHSSVSLDKGVFSVMLGGVTALNLPFDAPYWLGIKVGSDAEMTPRQRITSTGYSFRAKEADNAATVDGYSASATPAANTLLPLDANAKVPSAALKLTSYDSGWFPVSNSNNPRSTTLTHNLGTTKVLGQIWFSTESNGSTNVCQVDHDFDWANGNKMRGGQLEQLTATTVKVVWGYSEVCHYMNDTSDWGGYTSGYYRVVLFPLD